MDSSTSEFSFEWLTSSLTKFKSARGMQLLRVMTPGWASYISAYAFLLHSSELLTGVNAAYGLDSDSIGF